MRQYIIKFKNITNTKIRIYYIICLILSNNYFKRLAGDIDVLLSYFELLDAYYRKEICP